MLSSAFMLTNFCINRYIILFLHVHGYAKTQCHLIYKSWFECFSWYIIVMGDTNSKVLDTLIASPIFEVSSSCSKELKKCNNN